MMQGSSMMKMYMSYDLMKCKNTDTKKEQGKDYLRERKCNVPERKDGERR
jgi:hypothetical protein